jgi:hypothetical protein
MTDHIASHHFQQPRVQPLVGSRWSDCRDTPIAARVRVIARHGATVQLQPDSDTSDGPVFAVTLAELAGRYLPAREVRR